MLSGSRCGVHEVFLPYTLNEMEKEEERNIEKEKENSRWSAHIYTWKDNRLSDCQPVCLAGHTFTGQTRERETDVEEYRRLVNLDGMTDNSTGRSFTWWWICSRLFFILNVLSLVLLALTISRSTDPRHATYTLIHALSITIHRSELVQLYLDRL